MSKFKKKSSAHTPAPWETCCTIDGKDWDVCMEGAGDKIADLRGMRNAEANALLIAQAPTLLAENEKLKESNAELLEALEFVKDEVNTFVRQEILKRAISRAKE